MEMIKEWDKGEFGKFYVENILNKKFPKPTNLSENGLCTIVNTIDDEGNMVKGQPSESHYVAKNQRVCTLAFDECEHRIHTGKIPNFCDYHNRAKVPKKGILDLVLYKIVNLF